MRVVFDNLFAQYAAGKFTAGEQVGRLRQGPWDVRQRVGLVNVALKVWRGFDLVGDPVQTRGQGGGVDQVRVAVGAGYPALDSQ